MARKKTRRGTTTKKTRGSKRRGRPPGSVSKKKTTVRRKTGRRGRPRTLSTLSSEQLRGEINRRMEDLQQRRQELQSELNGLQQELEVLGAPGGGGASGMQGAPRKKRGRPKGSKNKTTRAPAANGRRRRRGRGGQSNLADALSKVLSGREMGISQMAEEVKRSGYRTNSSNFTAVVSQTLGRNPDLFKKAGRGRYTTR